MNKVFLLTGSNLGNRLDQLLLAEERIREISEIVKTSSIFKSPSWGYESIHDFLNQVLEIRTSLTPRDLLHQLQKIEKEAGRDNSGKHYQDRELDIDILFFNDDVIQTDDLIIPHPRLHLRAFTLKPLFEIAPGLIHPVLKKTILELLEKCPDSSNTVRKT